MNSALFRMFHRLGLGGAYVRYIRYRRYKSGNVGPFVPSYIGERNDVLGLMPDHAGKPCRALDIGCSTGSFGAQLKRRFGAEVVGVEADGKMAKLARRRLAKVIEGDIERIDLKGTLGEGTFDWVFCLDILEHLRDPWGFLKAVTALAKDDGLVVASIPNVGHYSTIANLLLRGYWPYRDRGIHDRSHLRFFTLKNIRELFDGAGLKIVSIKRNYRIVESLNPINVITKLLVFPLIFREFFTFQYIVAAEKKK